MKKAIIMGIALCCLCVNLLKAQAVTESFSTKDEEKQALFKNRLFVDFFTTFWLDLPHGVKQEGFNRGVNAALLYDIPLKKNSPFSFGLGVGVCSHNLYSNAYTFINNEYKVVMEAFPSGTEYHINKLSFT